MRITVTQEHIDQGKHGSNNSCPIALACIDAGLSVPAPTSSEEDYLPSVTSEYIRIYEMDHAYDPNHDDCDYWPSTKYPLTEEAKTFVSNFDSGGPTVVKPFSFELPIE